MNSTSILHAYSFNDIFINDLYSEFITTVNILFLIFLNTTVQCMLRLEFNDPTNSETSDLERDPLNFLMVFAMA